MRETSWKHLFAGAALSACLLWAGAAFAASGRAAPEPAPAVEFMAGQMIMAGFEGTAVPPGSPVLRDVSAGRMGGVVLFDVDTITRGTRNIVSLPQIRALTAALQAAAPYPLFIAVDQEGGRVQRIKAAHGLQAHPSHAGLDPAYPASLSRAATTDLLRGMGFDGVAITDDLQMEAVAGRRPLRERVRLAVLAGADILLFGNNTRRRDPDVAARAHAVLVELVRTGVVPEARLRQSWERIRRLKEGL